MDDVGRGSTTHAGATIIIAAALMVVGLVMVMSATAPLDRSYFDEPIWRTVFGRQVLFILVGLIVMVVTSRAAVPFLGWRRARRLVPQVLFVVALLGLVAAFIPGWSDARHGSQRWLRFTPAWAGVGFQPSELAKLALVGFLAMWLSKREIDTRSFQRGLLPAAVAIGLCVLLTGKEDFSTAVLLGGVGLMMLLVSGCRVRHILVLGSLGAGGLSVLLLAAPYRVARLTAFQHFWDDPRGAGYQPLQSLATIASGGWLGTGLGAGVQKYGYLPESHSDFIFAIICEEAGVLGGGLVIALFCAFIWVGLRTMWSARTDFERLLAFGITSCIALQATMNIAVVTVVMPTTGIPLPLVSAGGSGLLMFCLAIGLLAAIAMRGNGRVPLAGSSTYRDDSGCIRFVRQEGVKW